MKKTKILGIAFFILPFLAFSQDIGQQVLDAAILKLENAKSYTLKVSTLMPAEKYEFKPSTDEMSFGEQLLHLSSNMAWLSAAYLGGAKNPISNEDKAQTSKKEILVIVEKTYNYALETLHHFKKENLLDTVKFFAGPMNKLQILTLLNDHQTHHRAQILVYLRLNGLKPPDYIGW